MKNLKTDLALKVTGIQFVGLLLPAFFTACAQEEYTAKEQRESSGQVNHKIENTKKQQRRMSALTVADSGDPGNFSVFFNKFFGWLPNPPYICHPHREVEQR